MASPVRVGVVGCGNIAQIMHIPYVDEYEHFELIALADVYEPVLNAVADRYDVSRRYTDWRELVAQDDIDAVILCHAGSHAEAIIGAVDAGKHVLVEKPVAWTVREVREVAARVAQSDRIVQVGYHKLYDPAFRYARQQVQQMNEIGLLRIAVFHPPDEMGHSPHRIRRGNGQFKDGHIDVVSWDEQVRNILNGLAGGEVAPLVDEALGARKNRDDLRAAYGLMVASLIHQVYVLFGFLDAPQRVISTEIWRDGLSMHTLLEYSENLRVTLDWHFLSHVKVYREEYSFYGNHDRITFHLPSPYLKNAPSPVIITGGDGEMSWEKHVTVSYDEAFRNELLAFHDNIQNKTQPATNMNEAVRHHELIQAMIDAAR
jgi:predicted dehydrogenase